MKSIRSLPLSASVLVLLLAMSCSGEQTTTVVSQLGTMHSVEEGHYDGSYESARLLDYGDLGLGTFDKLDGEMIITDHRVWQVKADGTINDAQNLSALLATVTEFSPTLSQELIEPRGKEAFQQLIEELVPNKDQVIAIRVRGVFSRIAVRSVPAQSVPYPPLAQVVQHQSVFEKENISGTLVGYRTPASNAALTGAGFHFHFLADDHLTGGHVLDLVVQSGRLEISEIEKIETID